MNGCSQMQAEFTEYLDGRLSGREMQSIAAHLDDCQECAREWKSLRAMQATLAALGPAPEPADLPLRIRVAVSQERARSRRSIFTALGPGLEKHRGSVPAAGLGRICQRRSAMGSVIVLATMFAQPETAHASRTSRWATPPRRGCSIFPAAWATIRWVPSPVRWWSRHISTARARSTTIASSPAPATQPPARKLRTCSCSASLSRPASSASRSAVWLCFHSPAFRCGDKQLTAFSFVLVVLAADDSR